MYDPEYSEIARVKQLNLVERLLSPENSLKEIEPEEPRGQLGPQIGLVKIVLPRDYRQDQGSSQSREGTISL